MTHFRSSFKAIGAADLPGPSNTRIMMMPVIIGDPETLPDNLSHWRECFEFLSMDEHEGETGYLTIDEKYLEIGETHRRKGRHVDGIYRNGPGIWAGGWGGLDGMVTIASHAGCRAWNQEFAGWPDDEGGCDHLSDQCRNETSEVLKPGVAYRVGSLCVHESLPMNEPTLRQFVRLSSPSNAPWFQGYTINPLGVDPTGQIFPRREFMDI